jgi:hypothetical protein
MDDAAKFIWRNGAPPRVQFFGWLARRGRINCRINLAVKGIVPDAGCDVCHGEDETTPHVLFRCDFAKQLCSLLQVMTPAHEHHALLHLAFGFSRPPSLPALHFNTFVLLGRGGGPIMAYYGPSHTKK